MRGAFHTVPMQINDDFDSRILLQNPLNFRLCELVRFTSIQFAVDQVIHPFMMKGLDMVLVCKKLRQIPSDPHDTGRWIPIGIDKAFL